MAVLLKIKCFNYFFCKIALNHPKKGVFILLCIINCVLEIFLNWKLPVVITFINDDGKKHFHFFYCSAQLSISFSQKIGRNLLIVFKGSSDLGFELPQKNESGIFLRISKKPLPFKGRAFRGANFLKTFCKIWLSKVVHPFFCSLKFFYFPHQFHCLSSFVWRISFKWESPVSSKLSTTFPGCFATNV